MTGRGYAPGVVDKHSIHSGRGELLLGHARVLPWPERHFGGVQVTLRLWIADTWSTVPIKGTVDWVTGRCSVGGVGCPAGLGSAWAAGCAI